MKQEKKDILFYIAFGVLLFVGTMNLKVVLHFLEGIMGLVFPIVLGLLFAFILNVPMNGFERRLKKIFPNAAKNEQKIRAFSLLLTLLSILLVITLAFKMVIPTLVSSVKSIYPLLQKKWPEWMTYLESLKIDVSFLDEWVSSIDIKKLTGSAGTLWASTRKVASGTISVVTSAAFGFVISVYVLLSKKKLAAQIKMLACANLSKKVSDNLCYVFRLVQTTYSKFLSGQCVEAVMLGFLIFLAYSVFRIPYAGMIGFLTGIFAFVPYIGAFASCFIGALLILLIEPSRVLLGIAVYMVVQFIENQFIYPHVVGGSVGLAPLWTLLAALIGGKLFGLPGIIFFIPLTAALYQIVREDTRKKLREKQNMTKEENTGGIQE